MLAAVLAEILRELRMREQIAYLIGAALHRVHQHPSEFMDDLAGNAADRAGNDRLALPQRFRDCESKAFAQRFLDHNGSRALQGVDLKRRPGRKIEDDDVLVV